MSYKRARPTSSASDSESSKDVNIVKATRTICTSSSEGASRPLLCSLPPTCNPPHNFATPIANTRDLESHYAMYHAHVCEQKGCGCVFPDGRLLELHQTECHDPIAALRKERGEKIFGCHLTTCDRLFQSPKNRRLHLIQAHGYPKEYFFSVTNKGVGGLLKKWGEGASMIRGEWKQRDPISSEHEMDEEKMRGGGSSDDTSSGEDDSEIKEDFPTPKQNARSISQPTSDRPDDIDHLDSLAETMSSLSLVPQSIRFGRGGKNGGFAHRGHHFEQGRGRGRASRSLEPRGRGRGRGGGRDAEGGFFTNSNPSHREHQQSNFPSLGPASGRGRARAGMINLRGRGSSSTVRGHAHGSRRASSNLTEGS